MTAIPHSTAPSVQAPISIYIAAPYPKRDDAIALMTQLEAAGFIVTSTWLRELDSMADNYARLDLADVAKADCLLAFNPAGWENQGTGGRHVEYGYALALGKAIVLYGAKSHIFHHLNTVVDVTDDIETSIRCAVDASRSDRRSLALSLVAAEFHRAELKHKPMNSPHEGHSVIREELDELWDHVRADTGRSDNAGKEAIQVAAMGLRYFSNLINAEAVK